ncbi:hypothetical protein [Bacillus cereus]|uniref:hypothetical protein n=1 Tax=Bacillus cereus TaxID=1396 RepID=UPI0018CF6B8A|nr:hypothetical protein [Bacillus cereus]
MPVKHIFSIPLPNGNIGSVLQIKDGFIIICGSEKEVFDEQTFETMEVVHNVCRKPTKLTKKYHFLTFVKNTQYDVSNPYKKESIKYFILIAQKATSFNIWK